MERTETPDATDAEQTTVARPFEPGRYLTKVGGADYLEVKWRLVWLREVHPDAAIVTELVSHQGQDAIFRAMVSIPGGGSATGYGSEAYDDFRDYLEKAETKALGRALAALGFGTQFCPDHEFGAREGRVVDTPVDFSSTRGRRAETGGDHRAEAAELGITGTITPKQFKFAASLARDLGIANAAFAAEVERSYGCGLEALARSQGTALIDRLKARLAAQPAPTA